MIAQHLMSWKDTTTGNELLITEADFDRLKHLVDSPRYRVSHAMLIPTLKAGLERCRVVEPGRVPDAVVTMHSKVVVRDLKSGEAETYTLVFPDDADINEGRLSVLAPLGTALLGDAGGTGRGVRRPGRDPSAGSREGALPAGGVGAFSPLNTGAAARAGRRRVVRRCRESSCHAPDRPFHNFAHSRPDATRRGPRHCSRTTPPRRRRLGRPHSRRRDGADRIVHRGRRNRRHPPRARRARRLTTFTSPAPIRSSSARSRCATSSWPGPTPRCPASCGAASSPSGRRTTGRT